MLVAIGGLILVRRIAPASAREQGTSGMGWIYAAMHVMYGVTLAFSLFLTWQQFTEAQRTSLSEANRVEEIHQLVETFSGPEKEKVQSLAETYARVVIEEEWALLGKGKDSRPSPRAEALAGELRSSVESLRPRTAGEEALVVQGVDFIAEFEEFRLTRVLESRQGIPSILWAVLLIGGAITVAYTFLFGVRNPWLHGIAVSALTVVIVLVIYAVYRIDYPYTGDVRVQPSAFELVLERMEDEP
ncbi:MAG: DUF4239 domain-containing protein [Actinomycetota bacterium]|nr:DUF4239 domain-containing protein [Actinomycetota bacterium]